MNKRPGKTLKVLATILLVIECVVIAKFARLGITMVFLNHMSGIDLVIELLALAVSQALLTFFIVRCITNTNEKCDDIYSAIKDLSRSVAEIKRGGSGEPVLTAAEQSVTTVPPAENAEPETPVKAIRDDYGFQICPVCGKKQIKPDNDCCWNCGREFIKEDEGPAN
ncbi:MAG: hypothetical protein IJR90_04480 [Clostridia bacterium]|nr:hypothetical protein [Clostridia bacterium]